MNGTITWLGHSTFRLGLPDHRVIYIDPWLADNPVCPKEHQQPNRCDLVLLTHGHADHVGGVKDLIRQFNPVVVGNYDLCAALERQIGTGRYSGMNTGGSQTIDGLRVTLTKAFHSSALSSPQGPLYAGMPNGVILNVPSLASVYHAGDTDVFGDMVLIAELFAPKVCILPIGDHFTMGAKGAAIAARLLDPAAIVPCHYKTFPMLAPSADEFRQALSSNLQPRLVVTEIGEPLAWTVDGVSRS